MNKLTHKRTRFQHGSLTIEKRSIGPAVWAFRWREKNGGQTVKRKVVLGTTKELTKSQAQKKAEEYRQLANAPQPIGGDGSLTVAELVEHYTGYELGEDSDKAAKPVRRICTSSTTTSCRSGEHSLFEL
jgi:hypothetical protein